jgi:hypothetical protein
MTYSWQGYSVWVKEPAFPTLIVWLKLRGAPSLWLDERKGGRLGGLARTFGTISTLSHDDAAEITSMASDVKKF